MEAPIFLENGGTAKDRKMYRLLDKAEITGTCWVEFNISGNRTTYDHWHEDSGYASVEAMSEVAELFKIVVDKFDLFSASLIEPHMAKEICKHLDTFSSLSATRPSKDFADDLRAFLSESAENGKVIWFLGV